MDAKQVHNTREFFGITLSDTMKDKADEFWSVTTNSGAEFMFTVLALGVAA